jgi:two pore calcium channel protein
MFIRTVREAMTKMWNVVMEAKGVIALLLLLLVFYSWIGVIIYEGTEEGELYFATFGDAFWNMLILLTSANFPDIMLPVYKLNRWYCWFFITFVIFGLFFLVNLMIAVFYNNYRKQVEKRAKRFQTLLLEVTNDQSSFSRLSR